MLKRNNQEGQGLAEYALILALIFIVVVSAVIFLGGQINTILSTQAPASEAPLVGGNMYNQLAGEYDDLNYKRILPDVFQITADGATLYSICYTDDSGHLEKPCVILEPRALPGQ